MSYKIVKDGLVIDAIDVVSWVCIGKHGRPVLCDPARATGVISSDGSTIYHIDGALPLGDYDDVIVALITQDEYLKLKEQLDLDKVVPEMPDEPDAPPPEEEEEPVPEEERVLSPSEMRKKIIEQEDQINMLTECLLEMSEIVYGG